MVPLILCSTVSVTTCLVNATDSEGDADDTILAYFGFNVKILYVREMMRIRGCLFSIFFFSSRLLLLTQ